MLDKLPARNLQGYLLHLILLLTMLTIPHHVLASDDGEKEADQPAYKNYFDPTETLSIAGLVAIGLTMVLCTLGGIGGNIMIYPICLIFFHFDAHTAVGHTTILAGLSTFTRFLIEMLNTEKPTVNFDVVMLSTAPCIIGAFFGLIANQITPGIIIFVLATLLLFFLMMSSYRQYKQRSFKESALKGGQRTDHTLGVPESRVPMLSKRALELAHMDPAMQPKGPLSHQDAEPDDNHFDDEEQAEEDYILEIKEFPISLRRKQSTKIRAKSETRYAETPQPKQQELQVLGMRLEANLKQEWKGLHTKSDFSRKDIEKIAFALHREAQLTKDAQPGAAQEPKSSSPATTGLMEFDPTPASGLNNQFETRTNDNLYFLFLFFVNPLFTFLRGTPGNPSFIGYDRCGRGDFLNLIVYFSLIGYLALYLRRVIVRRNLFKKPYVYNVDFTPENTQKVMLTMLVVGFIGSFLSAGAATVLTFSLIMLKMVPFTASPTSLTITLMYGLSSAMVFFYEGLIYEKAIIFGGIVAVLSTALARLTIYEYFVRQGKASYLLLFISISMAISIVVSIFMVTPRIYSEWKSGKDLFKFKSPCS